MNLEELQSCAAVLSELSGYCAAMPDKDPNAMEALLMCAYVQNFVGDYSIGIAEGMEPFDAMALAIKGDRKMNIPESKLDLFRTFTGRGLGKQT